MNAKILIKYVSLIYFDNSVHLHASNKILVEFTQAWCMEQFPKYTHIMISAIFSLI